MERLSPYPAYKDSGVPWLGKIPSDWEIRRLKWLASLNPSKTEVQSILKEDTPVVFLPMERVGVDGTIDTREILNASKVWSGFTYFRKGDVLVAKITPCFENGKGACLDSLPTEFGFGSTEFHVLRAKPCVSRHFLYRLTTLEIFRQLGVDAMTGAAGQQRVSNSFIANFLVAVPSLSEQSAIVRYLDHADRRIRRYIRAKRRLIELLNEQKQATIHQAVTQGRDPSAPRKPSGVEWIGDVPAHWEVKRLKWVTRLQRGYDLPSDQRKSGIVPVVSSGGIIDTHSEARTKGPGIVMGRYGSTDAVFFIEEDFWPHNTSLFVTDFHGNDLKWCFYVLKTISKADHAGKSAVPGVDRKDLYQIYVAVPPVEEQVELVQLIEAELETYEIAINTARHQIDLIREYRTRLIADVVTGKLDVRGVALPEIDELAGLADMETADDPDEDEALDETEESPTDDQDD